MANEEALVIKINNELVTYTNDEIDEDIREIVEHWGGVVVIAQGLAKNFFNEANQTFDFDGYFKQRFSLAHDKKNHCQKVKEESVISLIAMFVAAAVVSVVVLVLLSKS